MITNIKKLQKIDTIRVENLHFTFEDGAKVFDGTTFEFPIDQMVWVQGESGSGRSTLLQLMAGLLVPQQGCFVMNGQNVTEMSFEEFLPFRLNIGYGFDMGGLLHNRTVLENLTLPLLYHNLLSENEASQRALIYMEDLGIDKYKNQRPSAIPGGVRKMVCLIRALIMHPQVLLLDDPTVGLGEETALRFFDLVDELRKQGNLRHIFLSCFDDKLMAIVNPNSIVIDNGLIHEFNPLGDKKVVHL